MSVLQRKELEDSPLADLHAIASELGLESYRALRKADLIKALLDAQGGEPEPDEEPAGEDEPAPRAEAEPADEDEPADDEEPAEDDEPKPEPRRGRGRGGGRGRGRGRDREPERDSEPDSDLDSEPDSDSDPDSEPEPEETISGVLDVLPNGSGFVRVDAAGQSRGDVYVSPAQIRRCELRAGDELSGPLRPARRNERHPSLVRVESVNGGPAEPPEERPLFADMTAVFPTARLSGPAALSSTPFGRGSRVAIGGPPGAGASTLLQEAVKTLASSHDDLDVAVVLVGVRPEEVTGWSRAVEAPVTGGSFDRSTEAQVQAAELAVERAKRTAERGRDAVIVLDSLEALPPGAARRIFGAARNTEEAGSVTVIAATGTASEPQRWATTRIVLEPSSDGGGASVDAARSSTLQGELLS